MRAVKWQYLGIRVLPLRWFPVAELRSLQEWKRG